MHAGVCSFCFYTSPLCFSMFSCGPGFTAAQCYINVQLTCCILLTFQWQGLLPISQWASRVTCSFSGVFSQTKSLALQVIFPWHKHRALLSKKKNGGTEGQCEQMGAFDIQQSGFIFSSEYFVTAYLSLGHGLKRGRVLWMLPVCLKGLERTLQFVQVSIKMRYGCVKNVCSGWDLCTDG